MKTKATILALGMAMLALGGCAASSADLEKSTPTIDVIKVGSIEAPMPTTAAQDNPAPAASMDTQADATPTLAPSGNVETLNQGDQGAATTPGGPSDPAVLPCPAPAGSAEGLACDIQSALLSRDMGALQGLMTDPFIIAYWGSEGRIASATEVAAELDAYRLPADTGGLTFATDRAQFPPLAGIPPETMFGPDVSVALVVYSEGWGEDGQGAALIYVLQNADGKPRWSHMVYAHTHFDR